MSGDGHRLQLRFLYLREPPLWPLGPPPPHAPHLLLLAPSPVPTQTPIHPATGQELYIEPCRQAMARDGHWPLSPGDPAPGHTAPQSQLQGPGNPRIAGGGPGDLFRDGAVSGPPWTVGANYSLYLLPSLSRAQDKTHPSILRPLPQREGTAHPAAQSLKSCSPIYPPHPSSSSFSSSSPPPHPLSPAAAWAQHQDKRCRCLAVHTPGPTLQGVE